MERATAPSVVSSRGRPAPSAPGAGHRARRNRPSAPLDPSKLRVLPGNDANRVVAECGDVTVTVLVRNGVVSNFFQVFYDSTAARGWTADLRDALRRIAENVDASAGAPIGAVVAGVRGDLEAAVARAVEASETDGETDECRADRALVAAVGSLRRLAARSFPFDATASSGAEEVARNGPLQIRPRDEGLVRHVVRRAVEVAQGGVLGLPHPPLDLSTLTSTFAELRRGDPDALVLKVSTVPSVRPSDVAGPEAAAPPPKSAADDDRDKNRAADVARREDPPAAAEPDKTAAVPSWADQMDEMDEVTA